MIALDTNLLVYAHRSAAPEHAKAQAAIERALGHPRGAGLAHPCVGEFWSVVTHPSQTHPSPPLKARAFVRSLIGAGLRILTPGFGFADRLVTAASKQRVAGARIFDLQIAVIAKDNDARELWSHDRAFIVVPGLQLVDPLG